MLNMFDAEPDGRQAQRLRCATSKKKEHID